MPSGFVSAGTDEDGEWAKARDLVEAARKEKEQQTQPDRDRSLYETLQANKAAKQEAFEESIKLKNQFRSLDEDEVAFLDDVLDSERRKEAAIKKQTLGQLDLFRAQQAEVDRAADSGGRREEDKVEESWVSSGRKRKKGGERGPLKGVKLRKSSSAVAEEPPRAAFSQDTPSAGSSTLMLSSKGLAVSQSTPVEAPKAEPASKTAQPRTGPDDSKPNDNGVDHTESSTAPFKSAVLGLVAYSSDDEEG